MNRAMERVTGAVPVACEVSLSPRWSKKAKPKFVDGRLVPCEIVLEASNPPPVESTPEADDDGHD